MDNIGTQLKSIRLEKHWSQKQLADASGIHYNTIINIEKNKQSPSAGTLSVLLDALGYEMIIRRKS